MSKLVRVVALAGALGACKSTDQARGVAFCNAFPSQAAATRTCVNCSFSSGANETDGNLDTAVSVTPAASSTTNTATLRVGGSQVASGTLAGVFVTEPANTTFTRTIRTFLGGVQKDTATGSQLSTRRSQDGTAAAGYVGMTTTQPFDAVEYEVTSTYTASQTPVYYVYEVCSDGGVE